jgi:hypothetical protein
MYNPYQFVTGMTSLAENFEERFGVCTLMWTVGEGPVWKMLDILKDRLTKDDSRLP